MRLESMQSFVAIVVTLNVLTLNAGFGMAAPPVIGTAVAMGPFRVDNSTVTGNATLFEGVTVETGTTGSSMELSNGARISLASGSKGKFFGDRMVLERGEGQFHKGTGFRLEALGLTIQPETGSSSARVVLAGSTQVRAMAVTGSFRVLNAQGVLVANLFPGRALAFEPQVSSTASKLTGMLQKKGSHYLLTDETANVVVEVAGPGLAKEVGNRVQVTGSMDPAATPVQEATQFIRVTSVVHLGTTGAAAAAATGKGAASGGAAPAGAVGTAAGGSTGVALSTTTIAIIGGVAAAGLVGGLAAAGDLSSKGGTAVDISR